jgi:preprotein translocase subunit SecG
MGEGFFTRWFICASRVAATIHWLVAPHRDHRYVARMQAVILVVHLLIALALIGAVLLQRSEGGALGIGGGGAGSLFTSRGVGNALTRATAILAAAFFLTSITLTVLATRGGGGGSLIGEPTGQPSQGGTALPELPEPPKAPQVPVSQ